MSERERLAPLSYRSKGGDRNVFRKLRASPSTGSAIVASLTPWISGAEMDGCRARRRAHGSEQRGRSCDVASTDDEHSMLDALEPTKRVGEGTAGEEPSILADIDHLRQHIATL